MDTGCVTIPEPYDSDLPETEVTPDPQVEKRTRLSFSLEYKLRIIAEADQCRHGDLGAGLRREDLYSNQPQAWRHQLAEGGEQALSKTAPGPKLKFTSEQREIEKILAHLDNQDAPTELSRLPETRASPQASLFD